MAEDEIEGLTLGDFNFTHPQHLSFHKTLVFYGSNPTHHKPYPSPKQADPDLVMFINPSGALPLSLFGEVEDENGEEQGKVDDVQHDFNIKQNSTSYGKLNGGFDPKIISGNGSGLNFDNDYDGDDGDEWEFRGAVSGIGDDMQGNIQGGSSVVSGEKVEKVVMMPLENQDALGSVKHKADSNSFSFQSNDLFVASPMNVNNSNENNVGFKATNVMTSGFMWDAFPGAEDISNGSGIIATATNSTDHKPGLSSSLPRSHDLFVDSLGANNISNEIDVGRKSITLTTNGFTWDAFTEVEKIGNGSEISDSTAELVEHKPHSSSFFPPSDDLCVAPLGAIDKSSETVVGLEPTTVAINSSRFETISVAINSSRFEAISMTTNDFMFDAFPEVLVGGNRNGLSVAVATTTNEDDDFDNFGDFIDASQEVSTREQQEQIVPHMTVVQAESENSKSEDMPSLLINSREALPLSLFGDNTEEINETLNHSDETVHKPTSSSRNGFSGDGSVVSIHDLISNLYSQAQSTLSICSDGKPDENGVHNSQEKELPPLGGDDEWDNDSWEFKDAFQAANAEQPSNAIPGNVAQIQFVVSRNAQNYIAFYTELRDSLCLLLSCQLDELQKVRDSDTGIGFAKVTETPDNEIQGVRKLLEQSLFSLVVSEKHPEKSSCLNEVFKILEGSEFKMIESEYSLSKKLQLAVNDWKVAADLLRHAISVLKTLSLASSDEQFCYASIWSTIVNVCAQELRYGALIWKSASEKKVQQQVLSDCRGQKHIQALGEIYKVIELLGLSVKVYKAWMLFSISDSSQFMGVLNECRDLWSSSGLEEALQNLSDDLDFGCDETTKALLASIQNIRDFDVLAMDDYVFGQHKSICRLSLLPQELLPGLKTVLWNGQPYFISLANLWANLISPEPPKLPLVQVSKPDG